MISTFTPMMKLNDLFNLLVEFEKNLDYKFGFKAGVKFLGKLLEE
ncbi:hypothetical protein [Clostridioides difficile]